jgi:hypothetical protein
MEWINLHCSLLAGPDFLGAEPVDRATWLCLLRFCVVQENGGIIYDCDEWGDRKWQQLCGVTASEAGRASALWTWFDGSLRVAYYPADKEAEVKAKRQAGRTGGLVRTQAKTEASRLNGAKHQPKQNPSNNPTEGEGEGEGERKVVEEPTQPPPPTISHGAIDTASLIAEFGLSTAPKDVSEWKGGLNRVAKCSSVSEARAFLRWAIHVCKKQGVVVQHYRHVRLLAQEWASSQVGKKIIGVASEV